MPHEVLAIRPTLEVRDVARSIAFYADALGLAAAVTMGDPPDFAMLAVPSGAVLLAVARVDAPAVATIACCYVDVDDVEAAHARCSALGTAGVTDPETHPWGMRDFLVHDPDGHTIAVGERVG